MTDEELNLAETTFRHPPSASVPSELGLRLVALVRELQAKLSAPVLVSSVSTDPTLLYALHGIETLDMEAARRLAAREVLPDELPTPPAAPAAKRKAGK